LRRSAISSQRGKNAPPETVRVGAATTQTPRRPNGAGREERSRSGSASVTTIHAPFTTEVECKIAPVRADPHANAARRVKDRLLNLGRSCKSISRSSHARVCAAGFAPTSGQVVTEFQPDSSRTDSLVRILHAQPRSPVLKVSHFSTAAVAAISSSMAGVLSQPGCRPRRKPGVASPFYRAEADTDVSEAPSDEGGGIESASAAT
jgi:hypothetical protein